MLAAAQEAHVWRGGPLLPLTSANKALLESSRAGLRHAPLSYDVLVTEVGFVLEEHIEVIRGVELLREMRLGLGVGIPGFDIRPLLRQPEMRNLTKLILKDDVNVLSCMESYEVPLLAELRQLQTLAMGVYGEWTEEAAGTLSKLPELTALQLMISSSIELPWTDLHSLMITSCTHLRVLSLHGFGMPTRALFAHATLTSTLEELYLDRISDRHMDSADWVTVFQSFARLHTFGAWFVENLGEAIVQLHHAQQLRTFVIGEQLFGNELSRVTPPMLTELLTRCPQLHIRVESQKVLNNGRQLVRKLSAEHRRRVTTGSLEWNHIAPILNMKGRA